MKYVALLIVAFLIAGCSKEITPIPVHKSDLGQHEEFPYVQDVQDVQELTISTDASEDLISFSGCGSDKPGCDEETDLTTMWWDTAAISFEVHDGEVFAITYEGDFVINGRTTVNDLEMYRAMKSFLEGTTHYHSDEELNNKGWIS